MARGGGPEGGDGAGAPGVRYPLPGVWGGGVGMPPPPPWVLVVVLWVYTPDGDFSVMPLSTSSIRSSSITTAGTRGGGRDVGGHGDTSGGGSIPFSSPTPPLLPAAPPLPRSEGSGMGPLPYRMWDGGVPPPGSQVWVVGWGNGGGKDPPLRAAAPLMRATGAEWVMTQWGGQHRAPTASLAAVWCYGGGFEDPPPPTTLVNSIIRLPPTQSSPLGQNPPTAIGISRAPPDRPPQPGRAPPAASSLCRTPQHPPLGLPQPH